MIKLPQVIYFLTFHNFFVCQFKFRTFYEIKSAYFTSFDCIIWLHSKVPLVKLGFWKMDNLVSVVIRICYFLEKSHLNNQMGVFSNFLLIFFITILLSIFSWKVVTKGTLLKLFLGFLAGPWSLALQKELETIWSRYFLFLSKVLNSFILNLTFLGSVTKTITLSAKL